MGLEAIAASALRKLTGSHDKKACNDSGGNTGQSLATPAWAVAPLHCNNPPLIEAIAAAAIRKLTDFAPEHISNPAWAVSALEFAHQPLLDATSSSSIALCGYGYIGNSFVL